MIGEGVSGEWDRYVENAFCVVMAVLLDLKVDLI